MLPKHCAIWKCVLNPQICQTLSLSGRRKDSWACIIRDSSHVCHLLKNKDMEPLQVALLQQAQLEEDR